MFRHFIGVCFLLLFPLQVFGAGIVINEVLFDPEGSDTGNEWAELFNAGSTAIDVGGWQLYLDNSGYATFPTSTSIAPGSFFVIHLRKSGQNSSGNFFFESTGTNMGNTSGSAALFSGEPRGKDTMKSFVEWGRAGETWESDAEKAGLWKKGDFIALGDSSEGKSIALEQDGDAISQKNAWILGVPTEGGANNHTPSSDNTITVSPQPVNSSDSGSSASAPVMPPVRTIKAYAGEDVAGIVGAQIMFQGHALGLAGEPLESGRFLWNFGDGGTQEGKTVVHIFQEPGMYTVGLHVSSGTDAASDYLYITVIPNQLKVQGVTTGKDGFLMLANQSSFMIDVGDWMIEDARGKRFLIPPQTKIAGKSQVAFSNAITGLFIDGDTTTSLYFPTGARAMQYNAISAASSSTASERFSLVSTSSGEHASEVSRGLIKGDGVVATSSQPEIAAVGTHGLKPTILFIGAFFLSVCAAIGVFFMRIKNSNEF